MRRALPWILSAILLIAFIASFSELQRVRKRFGEVTRHTFHDHQDVRRSVIRAKLSEATHPIVIMGDSVAEMAAFPAEVSGNEVINAGIGGMTTQELLTFAPRLLDGTTPRAIAVALGANDVGSATLAADYAKLLTLLRRYSPHLVSISSSPDRKVNDLIREACVSRGVVFLEPEIQHDGRLPDGIHLNRRGYQTWLPMLTRALSAL
jgi:lysophospholipase L1-like esterase